MKHFLLMYEVGPEYMERRPEYRNEHLKLAWEAAERGELLLGGALTEPVDGAVLLFKGESRDVAERFAKRDPYVVNGLINTWTVREWTTVVGENPSMPVRP